MKGVVFEVNGLSRRTDLNGKRGYVQRVYEENLSKYIVTIDEESLILAKKYMMKVYCLGLPVEYWKCEKVDKMTMLSGILNQVSSLDFYVFVEHVKPYTLALIVNIKFFELAFHKMSTEPLLRLYCTMKSQNETSIIFDRCCVHVPSDLSRPWFLDLSSNDFLSKVSRFDACNDVQILKKLNLQDYLSE
tara:strand:- start:9029 stop:9595 length:567 start_codon:yes stop_codon:yes gene_type:complete